MYKSYTKSLIEAGCDEVGVGCLAGPIVACSIILPKGYRNSKINDSKLITSSLRKVLASELKSIAISYSIGICDNKEVDNLNPKNASVLAMHRAINNLKIIPQLLLVDGNFFKPYKFISYHCIVRGDSEFLSIAAASIVAKDYRDQLMKLLSENLKYRKYLWNNNKGYPTKKHIEMIEKYGISKYHRKTFGICKNY